MADESVVIEVKDGVDKNISRNLSEISSQARGAYQNVEKLVRQLNRVKPTAIAQFNSVVTNAQRQMTQAALSAEKLATQQQRTATASAQAATAQQRTAAATANADRAQSQAAASALRLEAAQARAAAAADRQAQAQQRAAQAAAKQAASLKANDKELETITGIHDRFDAVLARNPKYQAAFAKGIKDTGKAAGLARHELQNLSFQVNDVVMGLATGQRPMQVFLQQGSQIGQIFGASGAGAGAIFRQLAGIVGRLIVRILPLGAAIGAALVPFSLFTREMNKGFDESAYLKGLKLTEDQMKKLKDSGEKLTVTFGDTFKATFQVIGRYAAEFFKPMTDKISKWWNDALDWMMNALSTFTRAMLGLFLAIPGVVKAVFKDIPASLELMFKTAANAIIGTIEGMLNLIKSGIEKSGLSKFLGMDNTPIELPRLELSDRAKNVQTDITNALDNGFKSADKMVDKFAADVAAQAKKNRDARVMAAAGDADKQRKNRGFDRAAELAKINAELDAQAKNMFVLSTARDAANRADEIAIRFAKEKQPLTQAEITALRNKIQTLNDAKEVQTQFDRIYQSVSGPQREYNASLTAAKKLLDMGVISQEKYNAEVARAKEAFAAASDPLHDMNKELDEQIKLLGMLGPKREVEQQVMQAVNKSLADGKPLRQQEIDDLRTKLQLVQQLNIQSQMRDELQANSAAQRSLNMQDRTQAAISQVGVNGFTAGDAVSQLGQDNPGLQATQAYTQQQLAAYQDMYAQINELRNADVISEQDAMRAKFAIFSQQSQMYFDTASGIFGNLAQLRNSDNKKAARIGKAAAIAQTTIQTYQAAMSAYQSASAIPIVGWVLGPIAAAAAVAAGMAQVQQIKSQDMGTGYMSGGYTGNLPTNQVAGAVHGKEYVMNAGATSRIGVSDLEALQRGAASVQRHSDTAQAGADRAMSSKPVAPVVVPAPTIKMINVSSEQEARNFANSDENEQVVMNILEKNRIF